MKRIIRSLHRLKSRKSIKQERVETNFAGPSNAVGKMDNEHGKAVVDEFLQRGGTSTTRYY